MRTTLIDLRVRVRFYMHEYARTISPEEIRLMGQDGQQTGFARNESDYIRTSFDAYVCFG